MNFRAALRFVELLFFVLVMEGNLGVKAAGVCLGESFLMARQRAYAASFGLKAAGVVFGASILMARQRGVCGKFWIKSRGCGAWREFLNGSAKGRMRQG